MPPHRRYISTKLHGVTSRMTVFEASIRSTTAPFCVWAQSVATMEDQTLMRSLSFQKGSKAVTSRSVIPSVC
jgi:hypothetical protein